MQQDPHVIFIALTQDHQEDFWDSEASAPFYRSLKAPYDASKISCRLRNQGCNWLLCLNQGQLVREAFGGVCFKAVSVI